MPTRPPHTPPLRRPLPSPRPSPLPRLSLPLSLHVCVAPPAGRHELRLAVATSSDQLERSDSLKAAFPRATFYNLNFEVDYDSGKSFNNLHFLRVFDAGHMVPMNQPKAALAMLQEFIQGPL